MAASAVSRHYLTTKRSRPRSQAQHRVHSDDELNDDAVRAGSLRQRFGTVARQAALDPDDGISL
jgi:type IV secretion system protein VirD4